MLPYISIYFRLPSTSLHPAKYFERLPLTFTIVHIDFDRFLLTSIDFHELCRLPPTFIWCTATNFHQIPYTSTDVQVRQLASTYSSRLPPTSTILNTDILAHPRASTDFPLHVYASMKVGGSRWKYWRLEADGSRWKYFMEVDGNTYGSRR